MSEKTTQDPVTSKPKCPDCNKYLIGGACLNSKCPPKVARNKQQALLRSFGLRRLNEQRKRKRLPGVPSK